MSSRTIFLGRLIGLYCILVSLTMLIRKQASVDVLTAMLHNAQLLLSPRCDHSHRRAGDHPQSQCLVGRRCDGHSHAHRLDRADQGRAPFVPIAGG